MHGVLHLVRMASGCNRLYNHCVYMFDSQDQLVRKFASRGILDGRFDGPVGLAFDADDNLCVVCRYNHASSAKV